MEIWFKLMHVFQQRNGGSCFQSNFGKKIWVRQKIGSSFPPNFGGEMIICGVGGCFPWLMTPKVRHSDTKKSLSTYYMVSRYFNLAFQQNNGPIRDVCVGWNVTLKMSFGILSGEKLKRPFPAERRSTDFIFFCCRYFSPNCWWFCCISYFSWGCFLLFLLSFFCWYHIKCPN